MILLNYIDPGAGSILIQFIIAVIATVGFFFNTITRKIKEFIIRVKQRAKKNEG